MTRKLYVFKEGKFQELNPEKPMQETAFVQPDEIAPLKHPVTGKIYTSRSKYLKDTNAMGCRVVGNDWLNADHRRETPDISDVQFRDAVEYAESIHRDSSKQRAWRQEQVERLERYKGLIKDE